MGYFSPITPADRAFTRAALEEAERVKGCPLTTQERHDILIKASKELKNRYMSTLCQAECAQAGTDDAEFGWRPQRPFRR